MNRYDTVVIGAGLAGLTTACQLAQANQRVLLVAAGIGSLLLTSGSIDVLGYHPAGSLEPVRNPVDTLDEFTTKYPDHPYKIVGKKQVTAGLEAFWQLVNLDGVLTYWGAADRNWLLPSTVGAIHPTCLAPTALANGELTQEGDMLIVGFWELRDFYPGLISQNLNEQNLKVEVGAQTIEAPRPARGKMNITPIELAHAFEQPEFRRRVVKALKRKSKRYSRVGFPAVLGLSQHAGVLADLEQQLGKTVFEISTLPPSVPGRRLFERLRDVFVQAGGQLIIGSRVAEGQIEAGQVTQIRVETSNRLRTITANHYVLATGGIYGGGIQTDSDGATAQVWEPIFNLPVAANANRHRWFDEDFLASQGQPVAQYGVQVNQQLNPVDENRDVVAHNLYLAGALIAGSHWVRGRTGDGAALATATVAAKQIINGNQE